MRWDSKRYQCILKFPAKLKIIASKSHEYKIKEICWVEGIIKPQIWEV